MSGRILAIDPGNTHSGIALINQPDCRPLYTGKLSNEDVRHYLIWGFPDQLPPTRVVIEMISSYGMPVGKEVFDTCVWIGRFLEKLDHELPRELIPRREVKLHHCNSARAKDSNIIQALVDRFTPGQSNRGKGTKAQPGWFHGFKADVWQAYGLAVLEADRRNTTPNF